MLLKILPILFVAFMAHAGPMEKESVDQANAIEKSVLPKLTAIQAETDTLKRIDALLADMPEVKGAVKGTSFGKDAGFDADQDVERLRKALDTLRASMGRHELNEYGLAQAKFAVNGIVNYMVRSAKVSLSELREDAAFDHQFEKARAKSKYDKETSAEDAKEYQSDIRRFLYAGRLSLFRAVPTLYHADIYNRALKEIESIVKDKDATVPGGSATGYGLPVGPQGTVK